MTAVYIGMRRLSLIVASGLLALVLVMPATARAEEDEDDFASWLAAFKVEAVADGISQATLEKAFEGVEPLTKVVELDRRQPEFTQTFWRYLDRRVTKQRIEQGRKLLAKHRRLFKEIQARYGVPPRFLVAFWGLESNFGKHMGGTPVITSLATLAFDQRRSAFFRGQLLDALHIVDGGHADLAQLEGSWAGAMGQLQFMPSTYLNYAVDGDGDGRRDLWTSYPDIFASAANYLKSVGWRGKEIWGREVRLPSGFDLSLADLGSKKPIAAWHKLGVRRANGRRLPRARMEGSIVLPGGQDGPAFLVYQNFETILIWNRSLLYALSVGQLSDQLIHLGGLRAKRPTNERPLRRQEVLELQALLISRGFDPGELDGVMGSQTRAAIRAYQVDAKLPADGYPTPALLAGLRQKSGN